jgi:hypothetical protein
MCLRAVRRRRRLPLRGAHRLLCVRARPIGLRQPLQPRLAVERAPPQQAGDILVGKRMQHL